MFSGVVRSSVFLDESFSNIHASSNPGNTPQNAVILAKFAAGRVAQQ
jgi:hypothetical protein